MAATARNIRSQLRAKKKREDKHVKTKKKNLALAKKMVRDYTLK